MAFKPKNKGNSNSGEQMDFDFINGQVESDIYDVRLAYVIDLGIQKRSDAVYSEGKQDYTYFASEEDMDAYVDRAEELQGEFLMNKDDLYPDDECEVELTSEKEVKDVLEHSDLKEVVVGDTVFKVGFRIASRADKEEVAYVADCVDHYIQYKEDDPTEKQYRVVLNKTDFKSDSKEILGYALVEVPPLSGKGPWTYHHNSMHSKLAKATGVDMTAKDVDNDVSAMLNKPFALSIDKTEGGFIKVGAPSALRAKDIKAGITELDCQPEAISFEEATVEQLQAAQLRYSIIKKIKMATNYEGSQMQVAMDEYEALRNSPQEASEDEEEESNTNVQGKAEEAPTEEEAAPEAPKKRRGRKAKTEDPEEAPTKKRGRKKKEAEPEPEESEEGSGAEDDLPFAPVGLMYDSLFLHCI